jgi:hypothetical protein
LAEIPWQCWDAPGFKECHSKQWSEAVRLCELGSGAADFPYASVPECVNQTTTILALRNCAGLCPAGTELPQPEQDEVLDSDRAYKPGALSTDTKILLGVGLAVIVSVVLARRM